MDRKKNKLPIKLIIGIVGMFFVFAFSMAMTTTTLAQQAATDTPTATETFTPTPTMTESPAVTSTPAAGQTQTSPTATPAAGATQAPSTGATSTPGTTGSTGSIPVTGGNAAPNAVFTRAITRLSNASDKSLENNYNDLLARLHKQQRLLNNAANKLNQFTNRFGSTMAANNNNNQNGLNTSQQRNKHMEEVQDDFAFFMRSYAIAQQQVAFAQNALNERGAFDKDGNLINRQVAINALALAESNLVKGGFSLRQIGSVLDGSGDIGQFDRREERLEQSR